MKGYRVYSQEEEDKLNEFCKEHNIKRSGDEFMFEINHRRYRISRYAIKVSDTNKNAYKVAKAKPMSIVYIKAKRSEVIDIYNSIVENGKYIPIKKEPKNPTPPPHEEVHHEESSREKQNSLINNLLNYRR